MTLFQLLFNFITVFPIFFAILYEYESIYVAFVRHRYNKDIKFKASDKPYQGTVCWMMEHLRQYCNKEVTEQLNLYGTSLFNKMWFNFRRQ
jgi:hypothetical protein